jgi:hypothetical protein
MSSANTSDASATADDSIVATADDSIVATADDSIVATADDSIVATADDKRQYCPKCDVYMIADHLDNGLYHCQECHRVYDGYAQCPCGF